MKRLKTNYKKIEITKLRHSGVLIKFKGANIYIDPFKLDGAMPIADIIFITHEHVDHCDVKSINRVFTQGRTVIVGNEQVMHKILSDVEFDEFVEVEPEQALEVRGLRVETVPAYNIDKFREPGEPYHPRGANGVGYILHLGSTQLYHMGDTDPIAELGQVTDIEILCVPVSGTYVMTAAEAANVTKKLNPDLVVPMHVDRDVVGSEQDVESFQAQVGNSDINILS